MASAATRPLLLHVGLGKTGTTAIQAFLGQNADRLLSRHGLHVLGHNGYPGPSQCLAATAGQGPEALTAWLTERVPSHPATRGVLSSEFLLGYLPVLKRVQAARVEASITPMTAVAFVRHPYPWVGSYYAQHVKQLDDRGRARLGLTVPFEDWVQQRGPKLDIDQIVSAIENAFGREHVRVVAYPDGSPDPSDLLRRFMDAIDGPWDDDYAMPAADHSNRALPGALIEFQVACNRMLAAIDPDLPPLPARALRTIPPPPPGPPYRPPVSWWLTVRDQFEAELQRVADRHPEFDLTDLGMDRYHDPQTAASDHQPLDGLWASEFVRVIAKLLRQQSQPSDAPEPAPGALPSTP